MEVKEIIMFLENTRYIGRDNMSEYKVKYNQWIGKTIDLLLQGEVYRQMIEKMKKNKYDVWVSLPGSFTNLPDFVRDIEREVTGE